MSILGLLRLFGTFRDHTRCFLTDRDIPCILCNHNIHLQDRIPTAEGLAPLAEISDVDTEVLAALTSLGYSVVEAQAALQYIPRDTPQEVETRLRLALQYFSTP